MPDFTYFQTPEFFARIVSHDLSVSHEVYDLYSPLLYGLILQSYPAPEAKLLLQQTFSSALPNLIQFEPGKQKLLSWLISVYISIDISQAAKSETHFKLKPLPVAI